MLPGRGRRGSRVKGGASAIASATPKGALDPGGAAPEAARHPPTTPTRPGAHAARLEFLAYHGQTQTGIGVRTTRVWRRLLGVEHTVIESMELEPDGRGGERLVVSVRPKASAARRCNRCGRRCPGYDTTRAPRRWRGLDVGTTQVFLQATTHRVRCPDHGVVIATVPWARPRSRFTTAFEDTVAWLVCHTAMSVVASLLRIAWRSVSDIITRLVAQRAGRIDRLAGLRRIGIDEISYRKGQRYLLVVVDHDTGRLVWAGKNRTIHTLNRFFDDLGPQRAAQLTHVSADGAEWIHQVVTEHASHATICLDAFHVVAWASEALDTVRRGMVNRLKAAGQHDQASTLKNSRWALLKNPPNLTGDQRTTLAGIAQANGGLYRAYLLKEQLREIFACRDHEKARALLAGWISWAQRSRLDPFTTLAKTITKYRTLILAAVKHGLSNARTEATNTHLRLLTRRAYGYHSPESLIAMAELTRGGLCPPLPGRS
jgi:transposase